jgi:hypothetical protein
MSVVHRHIQFVSCLVLVVMLRALIDLNRLLEIGRYHKNALEKRTAVLS